MNTSLRMQYLVRHEQEGQYLTVPFTMPPDVESLSLTYHYERYSGSETDVPHGHFTPRQGINIIDLGLIAPDGTEVGETGSDKISIQVSETYATPGYRPCRLIPGEWRILLGAYKVTPDGVTVTYELTFTPNRRRLLKGDLHVHTLASDGVLTAAELGRHALRHGLDFLAITDHNQMVTADALPHIPGLTLIPGIEWTHYRGHANFTGVDRPYDGSFAANTIEEVAARFVAARARGALITIAHPFDESCPFLFDLDALPFDCIEVWNGPMRPANLHALGWWHRLLAAGKKIPVCGGSDYHRSQLFLFPGGPTTCVYALSAGASDILAALRAGHAYIVFAPDGPTLDMTAGEAMLGDSVPFARVKEMQVHVTGLHAGDMLQVVTAQGSTVLLKAEAPGDFYGSYTMEAPGFARVEILREFVPGVPMLPALISNPIYFELPA
ncbi:MAG TPA: CehA/McbA family metallohydrolase [Anaerolineae bacterium]|nr:CehA/McbA family metallohydrolase [Anaerolineae bacterium]HQI84608.1 CehA/McbA family metallohydrolase [Anaerolineae bacterium]